jgi:hypothetical protein
MQWFRPVALVPFCGLLLAATASLGEDWDAGRTYYYPPGNQSGGQPAGGYDYGDFRPREPAPSQGRTPSGSGGGYDWSPQFPDGAAGAPWDSAPGRWSEPRPSRPDQPLNQYRFRPRPDDKAKERDDAPRFRPDADLARRSQRYWGVPGQEPGDYGGAPGAIFRPLRPEAGQTTSPVAPDPGPPPALPPALPVYPGFGGPGYYPY